MRHFHGTARVTALQGIQALRAAAALAVVGYHAADWPNGAAGVDVFFVISGFVMAASAARYAGRAWAGWLFLSARLRRIVPLYWLCSFAKMALAALGSPLVQHTRLSLNYCLASLLFLPVHDAAGRFRPVLAVGWTLSFEMLFYGLFAAALALRAPPSLLLPPVLAAIVLVPHSSGSVIAEWCNPIVLEFAYGVAAGQLWLHGWRLPKRFACLLFCASLTLLVWLPKTFLAGRFLSWGLPATGLVASMAALEPWVAQLLPRPVVALGDASYAIYLTHGFVLPAVAAALPWAPAALRAPGPAALLALLTSAAFGWFVHMAIERPFFRKSAGNEASAHTRVVAVLAGGGLLPLSGGVGILMQNLITAWGLLPDGPRIKLIDTRGGGGPVVAAWCFARALCLLLLLGAAGRVHLVHAHMTTRGSALRKTLLCWVSFSLGLPVIVHMHGADFFTFYRHMHPVLRWPLRAMLLRARQVVVLGDEWRRFLVREMGVPPHQVSIVRNGVPAPASEPRRPSEVPHIVFLGRLCARKGVPELIASLASPMVRALPWKATFAGDGDAAPFRAMLGWHRLTDRVAMPGWLDRAEIAALLAQADMLVLPSHHEAMPVAVLEALAASVPVIATPVGTLPEILRNDVNALLVAPGSVSQLTEAMVRLLQDTTLRERLAAEGLTTFRQQHEIGFVAARVASLYNDVLRGPGAPSWPATQAAE